MTKTTKLALLHGTKEEGKDHLAYCENNGSTELQTLATSELKVV